MLAFERAVVVRVPHLVGDLQRLFQALEALLKRREGYAQPVVLALEPGGADPQPGAPAGEHVEGRDLLDQDTGVAVGDAGDHRPKRQPLRLSGEITERGVGLQHVVFGGANHRDLEVVVHHPAGIEPGVLSGAGDVRQPSPDLRCASGPGENRDLQADLHGANLLSSVSRG